MISLCDKLPNLDTYSAELIKIKCLFDSYKNDNKVLFWCQDNDKCIISLTDNNMIIFNNGAEIEELRTFVDVLSPVSIYSDYDTLCSLDRVPKEKINVMYRNADVSGFTESDILSSKELYKLLDVNGLTLPEYPYFAVDYCHRLNRGFAKYFALKDKCAIITFNTGKFSIVNGLSSIVKGYGGIAITAALQQNFGNVLFVCCRDKVKGFYEKYGFKFCYYGGYWVKNNEY